MQKLIKKWSCAVRNGKLDIFNREALNEYVKQFEGRDCYLTVAPFDWQRSNPQNRYYWGVVIEVACEALGYAPQEMHKIFKCMFLRVRDDFGFERVRSTTELTTGEFEDYLSKIRMFCAEKLNISIPEPNEVEIPEYA